jgi:hypothetical protein
MCVELICCSPSTHAFSQHLGDLAAGVRVLHLAITG